MDVQVHVKHCLYKKITRHKYYDIKRHVDDYFYSKTSDIRLRLIYKHTNKINGMCYVGQCLARQNETYEKAMLRRWYGHCSDALKYSSVLFFHQAIREFGPENFENEVIDQFIPTQKEEDEAEIYWIELYDCRIPNGYNMTVGGEGTSGHKQRQETIEKRRKTNTGVKRSKEICNKIKLATAGSPKFQISVTKYDKLGNKLCVYNSITLATLDVGIHVQVSACCKRQRIYAGEYIWRFTKENLTKEQIMFEIEEIKQKRLLNKKNRLQKISKYVNKYDKNGKYVCGFNSIRAVGLPNVGKCCNRLYHYVEGFIYRFVDSPVDTQDITDEAKEIAKLSAQRIKESFEKHCHPVEQLTLTNEIITYHESASAGARAVGLKTPSGIIRCCCGVAQTAGKFKWRYVKTNNI